MNRKAVLVAVIFLVSTLSLLVTPVVAQPSWRVYGWGAVRGFDDYLGGAADASGGFFFSVRGDKWMMWAYFRHPHTNELVYVTLSLLIDHWGLPDRIAGEALWDVYIDWTYQDTVLGIFEIRDSWRWWGMEIGFGVGFFIYGSVMFSRVRPYYMIF